MKQKLLAWLLTLCLLVSVLSFPALAADTMTQVNATVTLNDANYTVYDLNTGSAQSFSYTVPEDGATVLVFFSATCTNCKNFFTALNRVDWIDNAYLNVVAVESKDHTQAEVQEFLDTNAPNLAGNIQVIYGNDDLQFAYLRQVEPDATSLTWPLVQVLVERDDSRVIRYSDIAMTDPTLLYNSLCAVSPAFAGEDPDDPDDNPDTPEPPEDGGDADPESLVTVTVTGEQDYDKAQELVRLFNEARSGSGLSAFTHNATLNEAAMQRAAEIAVYFDAPRPNDTSYFTLLDGKYDGYSDLSQTILSATCLDAAGICEKMMALAESKVLSETYTQVGIGCFEANGSSAWVVLFGSNSSNTAVTEQTGRYVANVPVETLEGYLDLQVSGGTSRFLTTGEAITLQLTTVNPMSNSLEPSLIPDYADVTLEDGTLLASVALSDDGTGTITITAQDVPGTAYLQLPVYDGQPDPITMKLSVEESAHVHSYTTEVTEPTCTEDGYTTYTCTCGDSYTDDAVPALGHTEVTDAAVEASCTETGLTEGTHCSVCEEVLTAQEVVPALGHSWSEWVTVKEPTETEEGEEERTCSVCGQTETRTLSAPESPFVDVDEDAYYYEPVLWAVENGITTGVDETHFAPNDTCTRAQVVTFLWRAAGEPAPTSQEHPFTDLETGAYYYDAVLWAVENGITTGMTETTFAPGGSCTRAQVATFLWRAAGKPAPTSQEHPFTDLETGAYYYDAVLWAVEYGITNGMTSTTFEPGTICTRGQIVTFLYRANA